MTQTAADPAAPPAKPGPGRPRTKKLVSPGGTFIPRMPTNGEDLVAEWELPQAAWKEGRIKVIRKVYASPVDELLAESNVMDYSMAGLAQAFGPGDYQVLLSADSMRRWTAHSCKLSVSPDYAASAGFQPFRQAAPAAPQRPALPDLSAANALQDVSDAMGENRPLRVRDLASLMQQVSQETARAIQHQQPVNGMGPDQVMAFMTAMNQINDRAEEKMLRMFSTMQGAEPRPASDEPTWGQLLGPALQAIMAGLQRPPAAPVPLPPAPVANPTTLEPETMTIPDGMTEAECRSFGAAVAMLRPFNFLIAQALKSNPNTDQVAEELAEYVPGPCVDQLHRLAALTAERGPGVLAIISNDLATPRGAQLIAAISTHLQGD